MTSRQSVVKIAFNLANFAFIAAVDLVVFHGLGSFTGRPGAGRLGSPPSRRRSSRAVLGALTIATAISLSGGAPQFQKLPEMLQFGGMVALANTSLALLAVSVMWIDPLAVWLLVVPLGDVFLAYRAYLSEREKHERLELLYQSSRILQHSPELDSALVALLDHARDDVPGGARRGRPLRPRRGRRGAPDDVDPGRAAGGMVPIEARRGRPDPRAASRLERQAFFCDAPRTGRDRRRRSARRWSARCRGESGLIGSMIVANRLTEGTSFDDDDLRLLETLANQAAVALENGQLEQSLAELSRLKEQLRYQAYHDPLTGLANRALFAERVEEQLAAPRDGPPHGRPVPRPRRLQDRQRHARPRGRRPAAGRCRRAHPGCVRTDDLAARLGGDEFASC